VKTILVLNKIDRLILELLLEPEDAYIHLSKIIEEVNAIVSQLINGDINNKDKKKNSAGEEMQLAFKNPEEEINLDEI
jgi:ribosome assembly protein 1